MRLIGADGEQVGVVGRDDALRMAAEAEMDLVEIVPNADPPVCRIMDFGKFKFEEQKKAHAARKKQKVVEIETGLSSHLHRETESVCRAR